MIGGTNPTISQGSWHHFVITRRSGIVYAYIDGGIYGTSIANTYDFSAESSQPFYLGKCASSYINGIINDARIYNRSLSTAEILTLYNLQKPTHP